jgi:hypothetical protein
MDLECCRSSDSPFGRLADIARNCQAHRWRHLDVFDRGRISSQDGNGIMDRIIQAVA